MKSLARSHVWWPGLDNAIATKVQECQICQEDRPNPPRAPLHPWEWPSRPWARLHIDHAGPFMGKLYLVVCDAHSKWIDVSIVSSTSAEITIRKLRTLFATHGVPDQLVSDNGSGFASQEFRSFTQSNGIRHIFTSPYHPSSNGLAERAVQTFKHGVSKLTGSVENRIIQFLFKYRITPQTTTGLSPAELLMGRRLRSHLDLLHPDSSHKAVKSQDKQCQAVVPPRKFQVDDKLFARNYPGNRKWVQVRVVKITGPVSYQVVTESGAILRRHVDQLRTRLSVDRSVPSSLEDEMWVPLSDCGSRSLNDHSTVAPSPPDTVLPSTPPSSTSSLPEPVTPPLRRSNRERRPVNRYTPPVKT